MAGIVVNLYEDNGLKLEMAGYVDIPDGTSTSSRNMSQGFRIRPDRALLSLSEDGATGELVDLFTTFPDPDNFGTGGLQSLGSYTGDMLYVTRSEFRLATNYVSGTFISGNAAASNTSQTLADVGATPGSYLWYYGDLVNGDPVDGQFLRLNVVAGNTRPALPTAGANSNNVPAPTTPLLIAAGLLGGGLSRRLSRRT